MTIGDQLRVIRGSYMAGDIEYDEARKQAEPLLKQFNARSKEIAKKHGVKPKPLSFAAAMR